MKHIIFNEDYNQNKYFFESGKDDEIFIKNKKLIDLSHCSGSLILGHNNSIIQKSLKEYLNKNISIFAHPNIHAIKFSKSIKYFFPNFKKIVFCNSGSEAVTKALRISRAINNKKLIVSVTGSWHGSVDKTLFYSDKNLNAKPLSAGLSYDDQKNILFIPYNDIETSEKILLKYKNKINCIILEPVLACLPLPDIKNYLIFLEKFCKKNNALLIFDEIITGFRTQYGNIQNQYKIKPDLTTIGKVLGGGLPIGAIGISNKIFKKINNKNKKVFFGGTFSANSMSSFVGNKTLLFLKKNKKVLKDLIKKCKYFERNLNEFLQIENIDAKVYRYDTILRVVFTRKQALNRLQRDFLEKKNKSSIIKFKKYLFTKNIYYPKNGIIFFSRATSKKNLDYVLFHIKKALKKDFNKFKK
tara:strand:+ start:837 stop:2075 length:1239 start_codon:yes stop_codon:yes gene_type:complete